jgi:putative redox protein
MVTFTAEYLGGLSCRAVHVPSGSDMRTDAPADIGGGATTFSPTDLVATGLLTCIMTTIALVAERNDLKLDGMHGKIEKTMRTSPPRRIDSLTIHLHMPIAEDHPIAEKLKSAAHSCPVHLSLHPEITETITWEWAQP